MKQLLIGCGHRRTKDLYIGNDKEFDDLTTLDHNPDCKPDILHDLTVHPLPFVDNCFNEVHAYDVLEHLSTQGNYKFFFQEFTEYWRILKPNGTFCASVPSLQGPWAWGDPSHTRVITADQLTFLSQKRYEECLTTKRTDFRGIYKADFNIIFHQDDGDTMNFVLQAKK
jgi:predicted SAM-dependent methyltransferase